ncbi:U11/U12 small nuclear ribonucleoprotein 65 kDa protein isoform X3 [Prunus dulcis]|uniref:U11/U12 small nuclear ribonucleoprotein 65 kDa protein isoform X3 n=1 Tax=Prunus dulcis TaxID=3755 RepID=UPI0014828451|nr:U11/U12 small nuclear ribonucleoprotein 65 kDa protein isoform X3 [Prunus dulcis]
MQQQQQQQLGFEESSNIGSNRVSLLIRHLPEAIPEETLFRLLSHYGASSVRSCSATGRLRNCAFVDFQNEGLAYQAQRQLNGLRFLGKVLKVERATANNDKPSQAANKDSLSITATSKSSLVHNPTSNRDIQETEVSRSEPIAPRLGVDYPFPPHLEYAYPPPDGNILTNIVNALIAVPRFYTQEVDGKPSSGTSRGRKRVKREAIVGPAVDKDVAHEDVGLKPAILVPKERPMIKKKNPIVQIKIAPKVVNNEHKDDSITKDSEHPKNESSDISSFATPEELERGKLPPEEILSLPMFKNYAAGNPASVLYIKNLAKDIVADDFYYIFGSLFGSVDAAKSGLSLKLMQEGRMRGQAFVTFPSVELAHYALNLVNGYVFKGKPVIIQFGRNPAAGKAN